ncbi:MAG: 2OG-Fe(II) oxygenase [Betaproteobacteria bacterium]|nr:2OG-Fe(II) oxygenase [Betaproteobacteria bacterium]
MQVPVIDIAAFHGGDEQARATLARQWAHAFETIGFATLVGHGIPEDLLDEIHSLALDFFDRPLEEKMRSSFRPEKTGQGYVPLGIEAVARTLNDEAAPPDICEALTFTGVEWERRPPHNAVDQALFRANRWPDTPPQFRKRLNEYFDRVYALGQTLMRLSAPALELPDGFFDSYYDRMASSLRLVHYPDQAQDPLPGQLRYGAHTDYTGFTLLRQDNAPGGLQVLSPDGSWVDVPPVRGALVVNAGDLLARWTNDRWKSNVHRVINPPKSLTGSTRRLSIVLFTGPNADARIECLPSCQGPANPAKYAPIIAHDHLMAKIRASMTA